MRFRLLGHSGLRVSELCLGTMTFGQDWGWGASPEESRKIFDAFVAAGGNFIDTACNYTEGTSERYVGDFIAADRDYFVVASKYTLRPNGANQLDPNAGGNNRKTMRQTVEASLRRLQTDHLDLLYLHMWDFTTPVEEVMRGLDDLVRAGKVLYVGFSDTPAWVISYALGLAERYGWARPVAVQVPYDLAGRDIERDIVPMAQAHDLAILPWGVLSGGELTGKYNQPDATPRRYDSASDRRLKLAEQLMAMAAQIDRTPAQIAINWVRQQPFRPLPILGARSQAQMRDNLGVLDFELTADQLDRLSAAGSFSLGFPLNFLHGDEVRQLIFGQTFPLIDNHRA